MRKISKNRTEDDTVSSTNGSIANEEQSDKEANGGNESLQSELNDSGNKETDDEVAEESTKKRSSKTKAKKRKATEREANSDKASSGDEEYEVDKVIDSKKIRGKLHYLIRWKGYSADSDTWEPEDTLSCPELIKKFKDERGETKHDESSSSLKKRKSTPKEKPTKKGAKNKKSPAKKSKREESDEEEDFDENAEYEVERILEVHHKKNGKRDFLIHWKGWSTKYDSWEPEDNLNCSDLINKFMSKVSAARSTEARALRVAPESTQRFTLQDPAGGRRLSKRRGQRQRVRYDGAEE